MLDGNGVRMALEKLRQMKIEAILSKLQVPMIIDKIRKVDEVDQFDNISFETVTLYIDVNFSIVKAAMDVDIANMAIEEAFRALDLKIVRIEPCNGTKIVVTPIIK